MANYSSKPAIGLALVKASVIFMTILIALGLGLIAAKLVMDSTAGEQAEPAGQVDGFPRVVHMAGANGLVVMVIETGNGRQVIRVLDPATGAATDQPLELLLD